MPERFKVTLLTTLNEAREYIQANQEKGARCPCCWQHSKVYTRKIYYAIAASLIYFYRLGAYSDWIHTDKLLESKTKAIRNSGHADFSKLALWGLIVPKPNLFDPKRKSSGLWRITDRGKEFIIGSALIEEGVRVYNGEVLNYVGRKISIVEALGRRFNYTDLMGVGNGA